MGCRSAFWEYTYTTIVIVVIPLLVAGVLVTTPPSPQAGEAAELRSEPAHLDRHLGRRRGARAARHPAPEAPAPLPARSPLSRPSRPAASPWDPRRRNSSAAASRALALPLERARRHPRAAPLVAGAIVAALLLRRNSAKPDETAPEVLAAALDESLDDLRSDPGPAPGDHRRLRADGDRPRRRRDPARPGRGAARVRRASAPLSRHECGRRAQARPISSNGLGSATMSRSRR